MKKRDDAFTLIELIVIILILAMIAFAMRSVRMSSLVNLNAQAQALVSDIRYTQNLAATRGIRYYLIITSSTTYSILDINGNNVKNYSLGTGITFGDLTNLPNSLVAFDEQGTPYSNTLVPGSPLNANASIILNASDGSSRTITIIQTTGQVSS